MSVFEIHRAMAKASTGLWIMALPELLFMCLVLYVRSLGPSTVVTHVCNGCIVHYIYMYVDIHVYIDIDIYIYNVYILSLLS